jgi:hypothetical protein
MTAKLTVGQPIWYTDGYSFRRTEPTLRQSTITAVGRKWATFNGGRDRFNIATFFVDGYNGRSSKVYLTEAEYYYEIAVNEEWQKLRTATQYYPPKGVTVENIRTARRLLGIEGEEPK